MSATGMNKLETLACALAALVVTITLSWSFVDSTRMIRWVGSSPVAASVQAAASSAAALPRLVR